MTRGDFDCPPDTAGPASCAEDLPSVDQLRSLLSLRRDVRRFRTDPLPGGLVESLIASACLAPSVGLSQPWRFVRVTDASRRAAVQAEFESQNEAAAGAYDDTTAADYRALKLAGLREAPEQLAVFVEPEPQRGRSLGRRTMPEAVDYSVVAAIQNLWLMARLHGVGVGWVSIVRPDAITAALDVAVSWRLVAYLCLGYPETPRSLTPELETANWERRVDPAEHLFER